MTTADRARLRSWARIRAILKEAHRILIANPRAGDSDPDLIRLQAEYDQLVQTAGDRGMKTHIADVDDRTYCGSPIDENLLVVTPRQFQTALPALGAVIRDAAALLPYCRLCVKRYQAE